MNVVIAGLYWLLLWITAEPNTESSLKQSYPEISQIESLRAKFLANLTGVSSDAEGLVAGLAIGERGAISEHLAEQMKALSLTHLVAVSGANLAIVSASIFFLLAQIGLSRNWRFALSYLAMAGYVLLVGPESSVLRAATMASFVMAGLWVGRRVLALRMLGWAVMFLLVLDPGLAVDFGFALSVFATAGLLILATRVYEYLKGQLHPFLALGIAATFAAQLYTMPILLMLQPSIPVYSVLANLLVEPVVAPVTILGIAAAVSVVWLPLLSQLLTFIASFGTWWIVFISGELSLLPMLRVPFVPGPLGVGSMTAFVIGVTVFMVSGHSVWRKAAAFVSIASILIASGWVVRDIHRHQSFAIDWEVLNCDVGQGDALLIRQGSEVALVDVGRADESIDSCLIAHGVETISLLVLTHFDADHVGGIRGAVNGRKVEQVLVSGFSDDRPLVKVVNDTLASVGVDAQRAFRGMQGQLEKASWKVLSPTQEATEAEDSNDASITVLWQLGDFNLLTTGDLGEVGQTRLLRQVAGDLVLAASRPLVLKVAHHGSADQSREFHELIAPEISLVSVGLGNDYGHPTERILGILSTVGSAVFRTDKQGAIAISVSDSNLKVSTAGKLSM